MQQPGRRPDARPALGNARAPLGSREDARSRAEPGVASLRGLPPARAAAVRAEDSLLEAYVLDIAFILGVIVLVAIVALVGWGVEKL